MDGLHIGEVLRVEDMKWSVVGIGIGGRVEKVGNGGN